MTSHRTRSRSQWAGLLLAVAALASAGLETVSFGHRHVAGGHEFYHRHFFFGAHEHDSDHDADHDADEPEHHHEHDHRTPAVPPGRGTPWKAAALSAAPALDQPAVPVSLPLPVEGAARIVLLCVLLPAARLLLRSTSPRGPPSPPAVPSVSH
jgi:hypothetical protein